MASSSATLSCKDERIGKHLIELGAQEALEVFETNPRTANYTLQNHVPLEGESDAVYGKLAVGDEPGDWYDENREEFPVLLH